LPTTFPGLSDAPLWELWLSVHNLATVTVSVELGIFKYLQGKEGGDTIENIAAHLSLSARSVEALVGSVAALGYLKLVGKGQFVVTRLSEIYLDPSSPYSWVNMLVGTGIRPMHDQLKEAVLRDKPSDSMVNIWEAGGGDLSKERARHITAAMHSHSIIPALGVAHYLDFSKSKSFLDVAGGSGVFALSVAQKHPHLKVTILELPVVCEVVREEYVPKELEDKVATISLNMFEEEWPKDYDVHFFSNIFHDWDRDQCLNLAKKSFAALPSGGRIILHEMLLNEGRDGGVVAAVFSIKMLLRTKGKQFAPSQLEAILSEAGFVDLQIVSTHDFYSAVIGHKK